MQNETAKIYGHWQALTGVLAGNPMDQQIISATQLTMADDSYEVNLAGTIDSGVCAVRDDVNPIQLKIDGNAGPNAGRTFFAIVELISDDEIRVAYDLSGSDYPSSFEPTSSPTNYVATFKRC